MTKEPIHTQLNNVNISGGKMTLAKLFIGRKLSDEKLTWLFESFGANHRVSLFKRVDSLVHFFDNVSALCKSLDLQGMKWSTSKQQLFF